MSHSKKTGAKNTGRPPDPASIRATAEKLSAALNFRVTQKMVHSWTAKGLPIRNVKKLRSELATQQRLPAGMEDGSQSTRGQIQLAELRKKLAAAEKVEIENAKARGETVPRAGLAAQGEAIGRAMGAALDRLSQSLPAALAGRTATEIAAILKREFKITRQMLADIPSHELGIDFLKLND